MSYHCSSRNSSSRSTGGPCAVPGVPAATGMTHDVDCLSGICLPSSFQTGSWLLDHCGRDTSCEPPVCQPTCYQQTSCVPSPGQGICSRQATGVSSPCSAACSRPVTFVSSSCKPMGGTVGSTSAPCPPASGVPRTYKRVCVSRGRRTY
ncbi:keratin-associated protein 11-1 [Saccopteryx leptura]|uniref:keratin-associated protein 11-1 n=1 Tax=Saccopteryx leptura TaxID=249018 RepID=UPI00339D156F